MVNDMEENNRPVPAPEAGGDAGSEHGEARNRRRRGHRGGRRHGGGDKQKLHPETGNAPTPETGAEQAPRADRNEKKHHADNSRRDGGRDRRDGKKPMPANTDGKREEKRNGKNGGKNGGGRRDGRGGNRHRQDHIEQKDDIYGDLKEAQELAEWRAKIVLKSADGTVPGAPSLPRRASVFDASSESEEEVAIPEGIDLLGGPAPASTVSDEEKVEVIGVRFRSVGKLYYFDPKGTQVAAGSFAIVETARGPEFGEVSMGNSMVPVSETVTPLRPLIRVATEADIAHNAENREKEKSALAVCQKKVAEHKLDMKLIDVQYAFDNSKLLFYFSAEGRVDFRDLVKDLASAFHTRIELRQIGIRDEAKMLGGIGACGRVLCCSTFLPDFAQVSIKMAREQGLSLNSAKISGMCGRLMCCLRFEAETYAEEIRRTPANDSLVKTEDGVGVVISSNPLAATVRVRLKDAPDASPKQYARDAVEVIGREKRDKKGAPPQAEAKEASQKEEEEGK